MKLNTTKTLCIILFCFLTLFKYYIASSLTITNSNKTAVIVYINARIDEGTYLVVKRGVEVATNSHAKYMILVFNTYGGYLFSMDKIIEELAKVPCEKIAWIPPSSKAVSAGAIIALSCDEIFVARDSVFGVCQPKPYSEKIASYVETRIRALLTKRGIYNETLVKMLEEMVTKNRGFTGEELVKLGLAVGYANTLNDLLKKLGLSPERVSTIEIKRDLLCDFIAFITDPGVALVMLIVGILLIILEIKVTGFQGWGILGGVLIAISLYSMGLIGLNLLALTLVILGITSIIIELKKPGIQLFGITGIALLILAVVVSYIQQPYINIWKYVLPTSAVIGTISAFLVFIMIKAGQAIRLKRPSIRERLIGKIGRAKTDVHPDKPGVVYVEGEDWSAFSRRNIIKAGSKVRVYDYKNGFLYVEEAK